MSPTPHIEPLDRCEEQNYELDPVFLNARREAVSVLLIFVIFAACSLTVSYYLGNHATVIQPAAPRLVLGLPAWVFWGVFLPWLASIAVTAWFSFGFMADDKLSGETDDFEGDHAPVAPELKDTP